MARTYRRKNYEATRNSSWDTEGFKTAGHNTTYDGSRYHRHGLHEEMTFRAMTKREAYKRWRWYHGESKHANQRSPGKYYREYRQNQTRMINKQEIQKWIKSNGEYEPMCEADPRDCWWDWD
jgi:hypothetical protein